MQRDGERQIAVGDSFRLKLYQGIAPSGWILLRRRCRPSPSWCPRSPACEPSWSSAWRSNAAAPRESSAVLNRVSHGRHSSATVMVASRRYRSFNRFALAPPGGDSNEYRMTGSPSSRRCLLSASSSLRASRQFMPLPVAPSQPSPGRPGRLGRLMSSLKTPDPALASSNSTGVKSDTRAHDASTNWRKRVAAASISVSR